MELFGPALYGDPCRECGWDWTRGSTAAIAAVRDLPGLLRTEVGGATGRERHPDLGWSVTGYVAHVADNLRAWAERVAGVLQGAGPEVGGYDPDELARARRYEEIALPAALWSLEQAAAAWVLVLTEAVRDDAVLQHRSRGVQTAHDVVQNNAHDAHHHVWDVRRTLARPLLRAAHPAFPTPDIEATAAYYRDVLGFRVVEHLDATEPHVCLYRDGVEIILTRAAGRGALPHRVLHGYGYDAYLITADQPRLLDEFVAAGARVARGLTTTDFDNTEFVIEDVDGRWIAFGIKGRAPSAR